MKINKIKGLVIINGILWSMILFSIITPAKIQTSMSDSLEDTPIFTLDMLKAAGLREFEFEPTGIAICNSIDDQINQQICSDEEGGAIITWVDSRSGTNQDIYTQRINSTGDTQWEANGTVICNKGGNQDYVQICHDGLGGAIITWRDFRDGSNADIYAQRINSNGDVQWNVNGTAISTANSYQYEPQISSDENGGAFITWIDYRSGNWDIYSEKINSTGNTQWVANGTAICTEVNYQNYPQIGSDGDGGAIITWEDWRGILTPYPDKDIYAQKINSTGDTQWDVNGIVICALNYEQESPQMRSDGLGGAIITWEDNRTGDVYNVRAQRINSTGDTQWNTNGVSMSLLLANQRSPQLISDGTGGVIIAWYDYRSGIPYNPDVYAQKINSTGSIQWDPLGNAVCTGSDELSYIQLCDDNAGGAIIAWKESRSGTLDDIYSQLINSNGKTQWNLNDVPVCNEADHQIDPKLVSDGTGGAIITWRDSRHSSVSYNDIYAQRITNNISTSPPEGIPFGNHYLLFTILGVLSLIIIIKRKMKKKF